MHAPKDEIWYYWGSEQKISWLIEAAKKKVSKAILGYNEYLT